MSNTPPRYIVIYIGDVSERDTGYYIVDTATNEMADGFWYTEEKALAVASAMNEEAE